VLLQIQRWEVVVRNENFREPLETILQDWGYSDFDRSVDTFFRLGSGCTSIAAGIAYMRRSGTSTGLINDAMSRHI
jgi:hypothetical protein